MGHYVGAVAAGPPTRADEGFAQRLFERVLTATGEHVSGTGSGFDLKSGWRLTHRDRVRDLLHGALARAGFGRRGYDRGEAARFLARLGPLLDGLERTDGLLADERSRELLVDLLAFRALGPRHVRLPVTIDGFWHEAARVDAELRTGPAPGLVPQFGTYRIPGREGPITLLGLPTQVVEFFVLEQYAGHRGPEPVEAAEGDVVIDAGGGMGDTALYFADRVGPEGRVICLEFEPANLAQLRLNLEANPRLAERVEVVEHPLWDRPAEELRFDPALGRTSVTGAEGGQSVLTTTIDELVRSGTMDRVDFIKLDVEGAELRALQGAGDTLGRDRPKLAVSVYHHLEDLVELPGHIAGLDLGYELTLDHFLPAPEETVLFARSHSDGARLAEERS